ncbi:F-box domain-containing protein [Mycena venus]|uniref:F-box domain-containing protein n=1 Tax=Mycena venus TaxID=2733690 RepID=A0A8H7DHE0_9AGAR|nr:F-box domain-containing protein [Mycena venus]
MALDTIELFCETPPHLRYELIPNSEQTCSRIEHFHILDLPFEITAEIFSHFLPQDPLRSLPGLQSPTLLCQVCRQWRDIAISAPWLWKSLQLDLVPEFLLQQLQVLRTWLKRSGSCPLSIGITYKAVEPGLTSPPVDNFIQELMLHSKRWQSMEMNLPFEVLHLIHGEMPRLLALTIGPNAVPEPPPQHPLRLFHSSPHLEHIVLSRFFQPCAIQLCWENCTNLEGLFLRQLRAEGIPLHQYPLWYIWNLYFYFQERQSQMIPKCDFLML